MWNASDGNEAQRHNSVISQMRHSVTELREAIRPVKIIVVDQSRNRRRRAGEHAPLHGDGHHNAVPSHTKFRTLPGMGIDRRNYLFFGSDSGGRAGCQMVSIWV